MDYAKVMTNIRRIVRSVNLESKRIEKRYGVSIPQLLCLNFLREREDHRASQREIGQFLSLNASTVTGIVNRLEKKGLIAKLPPGRDRRVNNVTITAKGAALIDPSPELLHDRLARKLKGLCADDLARIQDAYERILDLLELDEPKDELPILTGNLDLRDPLED